MKHLVKWGIIGLGNIAYEFAKAFYNAENAELIGIASKSNEKLINFKEKFKLNNNNIYNNYDEILDNENIDIFYVALPNSLHFEWVNKLLKKKKNILIEKPAFTSVKELEIIFNNKNFDNVFLSEGYMYRYHPQIFEVIKLIKSGAIGKLLRMETNFGVNLIYKKNFFGFKIKKLDKNKRIFNKKLGGGVIFDHGCYTTSMSLLIATLIKNLDITKFKFEDIKTEYLESNIDVSSYAKINFDNKFLSNISVSFTKDIGNNTLIIGNEGEIFLENSWNSFSNVMKVSGKVNIEKKFENIKNTYTLEIENISKDIIEKKKESSFPGINKKDIFLNTKLISQWIDEQ